jgi:hypothetical protein
MSQKMSSNWEKPELRTWSWTTGESRRRSPESRTGARSCRWCSGSGGRLADPAGSSHSGRWSSAPGPSRSTSVRPDLANFRQFGHSRHFKKYRLNSDIWASFFHSKSYLLILTKYGMSYVFGRCFYKLISGHPVVELFLLMTNVAHVGMYVTLSLT